VGNGGIATKTPTSGKGGEGHASNVNETPVRASTQTEARVLACRRWRRTEIPDAREADTALTP
jgi:hypothetical protein